MSTLPLSMTESISYLHHINNLVEIDLPSLWHALPAEIQLPHRMELVAEKIRPSEMEKLEQGKPFLTVMKSNREVHCLACEKVIQHDVYSVVNLRKHLYVSLTADLIHHIEDHKATLTDHMLITLRTILH